MWNRHRQTADFKDGKQWLLRFFDQIRFYPVSAAELLSLRDEFVAGRFKLRTAETTLKMQDYRRFLKENETDIVAFKAKQQAAFDAERERWRESGQLGVDAEVDARGDQPSTVEEAVPADCIAIVSPVTGSVWQMSVQVGDSIHADQELLVVEAMKMEVPLIADDAGEVIDVRCSKGSAVTAGQVLVVMRSKAA